MEIRKYSYLPYPNKFMYELTKPVQKIDNFFFRQIQTGFMPVIIGMEKDVSFDSMRLGSLRCWNRVHTYSWGNSYFHFGCGAVTYFFGSQILSEKFCHILALWREYLLGLNYKKKVIKVNKHNICVSRTVMSVSNVIAKSFFFVRTVEQ